MKTLFNVVIRFHHNGTDRVVRAKVADRTLKAAIARTVAKIEQAAESTVFTYSENGYPIQRIEA